MRVDDVGDAAVAIASRAAHVLEPSPPTLLKSRDELAGAPIDSRDAFVLSLVDGKMSISAIVDMAGMPPGDVAAILDRLARLGILSLP